MAAWSASSTWSPATFATTPKTYQSQEALTRAAARWSRLREYEVPEAWVRRVAVNLATDGFRRARRRLALAVRLRPGPDPDPPTLDRLAVIRPCAPCPTTNGPWWSCTTCSTCPSTGSRPSWACPPGR